MDNSENIGRLHLLPGARRRCARAQKMLNTYCFGYALDIIQREQV